MASELTTTQRRALANILRSQPAATLGELSSLVHGELGHVLESLTIGDLLGQSRPPRTTSSIPAGPIADKPSRGNDARPRQGLLFDDEEKGLINSRTAEGRRRYDDAVLAVLREEGRPLSAGELRELVGGTDLQVRVSLQRLVKNEEVGRSGVARGTRYHSI